MRRRGKLEEEESSNCLITVKKQFPNDVESMKSTPKAKRKEKKQGSVIKKRFIK